MVNIMNFENNEIWRNETEIERTFLIFFIIKMRDKEYTQYGTTRGKPATFFGVSGSVWLQNGCKNDFNVMDSCAIQVLS